VLGIIPGKDGWHTYYFRRGGHGAPLPRLVDALGEGLSFLAARLLSLAGKPWRRSVSLYRTLLRPRG
jgi:hypothetical protein